MDAPIKWACATMASLCGVGARTTKNGYSSVTLPQPPAVAYLFFVRRMRAVRILSIVLGTLSEIVGVVFSMREAAD